MYLSAVSIRYSKCYLSCPQANKKIEFNHNNTMQIQSNSKFTKSVSLINGAYLIFT